MYWHIIFYSILLNLLFWYNIFVHINKWLNKYNFNFNLIHVDVPSLDICTYQSSHCITWKHHFCLIYYLSICINELYNILNKKVIMIWIYFNLNILTNGFFCFNFRFYKSLKTNLLEPEIFHINPKKSDTTQFRKLMKYLPESVSWYGAYMYNVSIQHFKWLLEIWKIEKK
jgi:hypothetical protein